MTLIYIWSNFFLYYLYLSESICKKLLYIYNLFIMKL